MPAGNYNTKRRIFYHLSKSSKDINGKDQVRILQGSKEDIKQYNFLEGRLTAVEPFDGEYDGQPTYRIRFMFEDNDTIEQLECGRYTGFTRDILNCLCSLDQIEHVRLTPFLSEDDKTGKKYVRGSVRVGPNYDSKDAKLPKAFSSDVIPKIVMTKVGKKDVIDDTELQEWTDKLILDVQRRIADQPAVATASAPEPFDNEDDDRF